MIELEVGTNTYCDLDYANSFFNSRPFSFWNTLDDEGKAQYLILAYDALVRIRYQSTIDIDDLPEWIQKAQCFEAMALFFIYSDEEFLRRQSLQLQGVSRFVWNKQTEEYKERKQIAGLYSKEAFNEIKGYVLRYPTKVQQSI
jgi:hypothetical protein